jgi:cation diffusion facilitator family transporter
MGVVVNALLAGLKLATGFLVGSPALLADGFHSLGDLVSGALSWVTWRWAQEPPDEDHHYGHGKLEALAAATVGGMLLVTGVGLIWQGFHGEPAEYAQIEMLGALGVAVLSVVANEMLTRIFKRGAKEFLSPTLDALARDNRSDMLSSVLVVVGVAASALGYTWVESLVAGVIGVFVIVMGLGSLKEGFDVLTDRVADPGLRDRLKTIAEDVDGVDGVQLVLIHPLGRRVRAEVELSVDGDLPVRKGHAIAHDVEDRVTREVEEVVEVSVHVNPAGEDHDHHGPGCFRSEGPTQGPSESIDTPS